MGGIIRILSVALLRLGGWRVEGRPPVAPKYVLIAAPHTSNWDFLWVLTFAGYYGVRIRWIGKHTLFRPPFGWLMRALGGIPVQRGRRQSLVREMAAALDAAGSMCLVVPVEGTRARVTHWKSGFYHIARSAGVPIVMGYLDYGGKRGGFGPALVPSDDVVRDMDALRAFYADKTGKHPENTSPVRLIEEDMPRPTSHADATAAQPQISLA
jgi:1-acyl-sn-glycerol-3-phosphate acyltransferase